MEFKPDLTHVVIVAAIVSLAVIALFVRGQLPKSITTPKPAAGGGAQ